MNFCLLSFFTLPVISSAAEKSTDTQQLKSAISLRQSNQHHQAVDILENLLKEHGDHKRINIELAINYIKLSDFSKSQEIINHLKTLNLTNKENKKLENLIKLVKNKQNKNLSPHRFQTDLSLLYGVDRYSAEFPIYEYYEFFDDGEDYSTQAYSEELVEVRDEVSQQQKEHYFAQQVKGIYRYRPAKKIALFGQETNIIFTGSGTWYQRKIVKNDNSEENSPKYQQAKFDGVLSFLTKQKWLFNIKYRGRYHSQNSEHVLTDHNIGLSSSLPLKFGRITFAIEHKSKDYEGSYNYHNATANIPSLEYSYRIKPTLKLKLGYRYRIYQATDEFNSYRNISLFGSLYYTPSDKLTTFVSYNHNDLAYTIDDPELVYWGKEVKASWLAGLKYQITKDINWGINVHYIKNSFDRDSGKNEWQRVETTLNYQF